MAEFHQNGLITTLHNLTHRPVASLEQDLQGFSAQRPMAVIIPSLFSELETPALANIVEELKKVTYIDEIIVGLDRADERQYRYALNYFSVLPQKTHVLWNDGPAMQKLQQKLVSSGLLSRQMGKGHNVWYCMGYVLAATKAEAIAIHDADIITYDRSLLARLLYPVANPNFNYQFCKGYYARIANNRLNGRVCRLLVSPLILALKTICGDIEYLNFMGGFKYALAGEFSFRREVLNDIRISGDWGLEMAILSEIHRNYAKNHICQVDIADNYDHKHQSLSAADKHSNLSKMSIDICKTLFRKLATQGTTFTSETLRSLKATYFRTALDYIDTYHNDALFNGLEYDIHEEEHAVELFAENIIRAGEIFLERPMEKPFIPSWNRVVSALPEFLDEISAAVESDHHRFRQPKTQETGKNEFVTTG